MMKTNAITTIIILSIPILIILYTATIHQPIPYQEQLTTLCYENNCDTNVTITGRGLTGNINCTRICNTQEDTRI